MNCLLSFAVILSLWSLWSCTSDSTMNESSSSPARQLTSSQQPLEVHLLVPVVLDKQRQPFYVNPQSLQMSYSSNMGYLEADDRRAMLNQDVASVFVGDKGIHSDSEGPTPSGIQSDKIATEVTSSGSRTLATTPSWLEDRGSPRQQVRSLPCLIVASVAICLGALVAKKALEKAQRWEQQSQEDSLAYDLAYTDRRSDIGYGSFVSTAWSDDLEKFDV